MLAEDAIKAAVKDYEAKRTKSSAASEAAPAEKAADAWRYWWKHLKNDVNVLLVEGVSGTLQILILMVHGWWCKS